jgi:hypothetical protein
MNADSTIEVFCAICSHRNHPVITALFSQGVRRDKKPLSLRDGLTSIARGSHVPKPCPLCARSVPASPTAGTLREHFGNTPHLGEGPIYALAYPIGYSVLNSDSAAVGGRDGIGHPTSPPKWPFGRFWRPGQQHATQHEAGWADFCQIDAPNHGLPATMARG